MYTRTTKPANLGRNSANFDDNIAIDGVNEDGTPHFLSDSTGQLIRTQCVPGSGDDIIVLPTSAILQLTKIADDPANPTGPTATPLVFTNIEIRGHGAQLVWATTLRYARAFAVGSATVQTPDGPVSGTGHLTLTNLHIKSFVALGGNGDCAGGGGLGAGGAIYVRVLSALAVFNTTFEGNGAVGGNSGAVCGNNFGLGGGGGGMGGDGGAPDRTNLGGPAAGAGGGGGGSRGNGGDATLDHGGGGGGTMTSGRLAGGAMCGGSGGSSGDNGQNAPCIGGGGGGGGQPNVFLGVITGGEGGNGHYGGGGGGGGASSSLTLGGDARGRDGGNGGFGGGGGGCGGAALALTNSGGDGGFGGGAGACPRGEGGTPGRWGGAAGAFFGHGPEQGGAGGALGGAIFSHGGVVVVKNSTFTDNYVTRGTSEHGVNGADAGGAIYSLLGRLTVVNATISHNETTGPYGGIVYDNRPAPCDGSACLGPPPGASFTLENSILAHNGVGFNAPDECIVFGADATLTVAGAGNLITKNAASGTCPGVVATADPQLGPLQDNDGFTPTMAISTTSPAWNTADAATSTPTDQRGETRPRMGGHDIGAFELCLDRTGQPCLIIAGANETQTLTVTTSSNGGTTTPSAGTYTVPAGTVSVLSAVPDPNFCFVSWTGNVTDPTSASTTVVMNQAQSIGATFSRIVSTTVAKTRLGPLNHELVTVGLAVAVNCGATLEVKVFGDENDETVTDSRGAVFSPDAANIAVGTLRLRAERADSGDGRVYLIAVRGTTAAGETGASCATVVVPRDGSSASVAAVERQAAAAKAYCEANNGAVPPGYVAIGDGPVIGLKQ